MKRPYRLSVRLYNLYIWLWLLWWWDWWLCANYCGSEIEDGFNHFLCSSWSGKKWTIYIFSWLVGSGLSHLWNDPRKGRCEKKFSLVTSLVVSLTLSLPIVPFGTLSYNLKNILSNSMRFTHYKDLSKVCSEQAQNTQFTTYPSFEAFNLLHRGHLNVSCIILLPECCKVSYSLVVYLASMINEAFSNIFILIFLTHFSQKGYYFMSVMLVERMP